MKRVLVTGGTGFIGSHLVRELLSRGYEVFVISRSGAVTTSQLAKSPVILRADITDSLSLRKLPDDYEYVFHLAAVRDSLDESNCHQVNVQGTRNLLAWLAGVSGRPRKIVHVSSLGACGLSNDGRAKRESDAMNPCSIYGKAKMLAEKEVEAFCGRLPHIIIRPCKVYGPGDMKMLFHFRMVRRGIMLGVGAAPRRLSLCYVKDLVCALVALAESHKTNEKYFISDGKEYSWDDLYAAIAGVLGKKIRKLVIPEALLLAGLPVLRQVSRIFPSSVRPEPTTFEELKWRNWLCDPQKFYSDFPEISPTPLPVGLGRAAEWFRAQGIL